MTQLWRRTWGLVSFFGFGGRGTTAGRTLPVVDVNKPTTQVRLRFSDDGSVVTLTLNESMTTEDLYALAGEELKKKSGQQQPQPPPSGGNEADGEQVTERAWQLAYGFPPKPIPRAESKTSLSDLGLLNASVTQRWM
eukprot:COSAG02_NODE_6408_length_3593_cov_2.949914_4_plen_137_part_00